jgi:hypothetical protein
MPKSGDACERCSHPLEYHEYVGAGVEGYIGKCAWRDATPGQEVICECRKFRTIEE